jgi:NADH dehydrogenase FAD-containing subunit
MLAPVGGGYVGSLAAKELDAHFEVTLIEPRDAMLHKLATLRAAVVPGWESRVSVPLEKLMKTGNVLRASVKSAEPGAVVLDDGSRLEADFVVLCHGGTKVYFPAGEAIHMQLLEITCINISHSVSCNRVPRQ